jgi:hypothetical protein
MTWNPYRVRPAGDGFRLTYSRWVSVPDGRGCIDWDEETEDADDPEDRTVPTHATLEAALQDADQRNVAWHAADAERKARQRRAPLP